MATIKLTGTLTGVEGITGDFTTEIILTPSGEPEPPDPNPEPPEPGDRLKGFALTHVGGSNVGLARFGLPFKPGEVPLGSSIMIQREDLYVQAQFDRIARWPDGSVRFAVTSLRDLDFDAGERRVYDVRRLDEDFTNDSDGSLADITSRCDLAADFTSVTGFVSGPLPALLAEFNEAAKVPTRVTRIAAGPICDGWHVWQLADGSDHLKLNWYVWRWKDEDGSHLDIEVMPIVALDWWSVPDPEKLSYDAALMNGNEVIEEYPGVKQPYRSHWGMVRMDDDYGHATEHWLIGRPLLHFEVEQEAWIDTGLVPPLDLEGADSVIMGTGKGMYVPGSCQGHRSNIDGTGGYPGRGMIDNFSAIAFLKQTPDNARYARVQAWAGINIPYHYRSNDLRTRPGEAADMANTVISLKLDDARGASTPVEAYDFRGDGLPEPKHAYADSRTPLPDQGGYVTLFPPKDPVTGITPPPRTDWKTQDTTWGPSNNFSHASNFCYWAYLTTGSAYWLEALYDHFLYGIQANVGNQYASRAKCRFNGIYPGIPTSAPQWGGIAVGAANNERANGFALNCASAAAAFAPAEGDPQAPYIRRLAEHQADYLDDSLGYVPSTGNGYWPAGAVIQSPWMGNIINQGARTYLARLGYETIRGFADFCTTIAVSQWESLPGHAHGYHAAPKPSGRQWSGAELDPLNGKGGDWRSDIYETLEGCRIVGRAAARDVHEALAEVRGYKLYDDALDEDCDEPEPGTYPETRAKPDDPGGGKPDKPPKPPHGNGEPEPPEPNGATVPTDVDTIYLTAPRKYRYTEGDEVIAYDWESSGAFPWPAEMEIGEVYRIREPVNGSSGGVSFKLERADGTPVEFAASYASGSTILGVRLQHAETADQDPDGYIANADSYSAISAAALVMAAMQGHPDATEALVTRSRQFHERTVKTSWRTWAMAVPGTMAW